MFRHKYIVFVLLAVVAAAAVALGAGGEYLGARLLGGFPLGTLLVILGLCAAAAVALGLSRPGSPLRWLAVVSLVAALAWFPVGYVLAGNAALNFSDGVDGTFFLRQFTPGVVLLVIGTMGGALGWAALASWRERRADSV